ncbi:hypothetical protein HMPREF0080_01613 [Anaeroglobus geminatus F0357]|uniref:Uncharacterized protein n=1 Tax=Anaeroglobus geminatus F0357 TaxID=861450 RepID=G9YIW9_9FIRM|nr:hypothetical protein HMPREF0080_01613 [Anaeroglobus geminatus F0357]
MPPAQKRGNAFVIAFSLFMYFSGELSRRTKLPKFPCGADFF